MAAAIPIFGGEKAIQTLDTKVGDYYKTAVQALTKRYSVDFAATYQETTSDIALMDQYPARRMVLHEGRLHIYE